MEKHSHKEDWIAILTGTFLVAQGVYFLQAGQLLTGGTTGLALLMTQVFAADLWRALFSLELPILSVGLEALWCSFCV